MKISTERFKTAVNKSIKGAGFNNLIPITSMVGIKLCSGVCKLFTTDMTNTLIVCLDKVAGEEFSVTVDADKFGKLISKMTCDEIELVPEEDTLIVKGNGTYKLPQVTDEEGTVEFPEQEIFEEFVGDIQLTSIMSAFNINQSALAKTLEQPSLTGYYCGDNVVSSDAVVITFNQFAMFDRPLLISPQMMSLLALNSQENIKWGIKDNTLQFVSDDIIIVGPELAGINDYPIDAINEYLDVAFKSSCKFPKQLMLDVLDRLSLFIEPYDKNGAYFSFTRTGIKIHSKKEASTESVAYIESKDFEPFTCLVDIPMLKDQLQANPEDTIKMWYGNENALKLENGKVIQVISLLEDE